MEQNRYLPKNKKYRRMLESGAPPSGSLYRDAWQALKKDRAAMIGLVVIVALAALSILLPMILGLDPEAIESRRVVDGKNLFPPFAPDLANIMGTDQLGRDIFTREACFPCRRYIRFYPYLP